MVLARAEVYNNKGNNEYRRKEFSGAEYFYTEGLKVNCKDYELNAKLYSNRASAYFCLGNNLVYLHSIYSKQLNLQLFLVHVLVR